jgi:hypothetical protein
MPFGKLIDFNTSAARWASARETSAATFGRPAIPMVWDFCETVPTSGSTGSWLGASEYVCKVIEGLQLVLRDPATVNSLDARKLGAPDESFDVYFTDPPYYDNVPYSYISDIFYVWQKRILQGVDRELYSSTLTPKDRELVAYVGDDGDKAAAKARFEKGLTEAFTEGARTIKRNGIGCVVFAHQTTEGWEALLVSLVGGGWIITSSWPIATERCPALGIFSRYERVEKPDGHEVQLAEYLEKVWEVVGRAALEQVLGTAEGQARNGAAGALEEDARLTALFLWTIKSTAFGNGAADNDTEEDEETGDDEDSGGAKKTTKGFSLVFDIVRRFAQPLGIDLPKWEGRVIEIKKGVVRLLPIAERAKQLFGEDVTQAVATRLERDAFLGPNPLQGMLFPEMEAMPKVRGRGPRGRGGRIGAEVSDQSLAAAREATTLDRVHAAMLLQVSGRTNALRALLKAEQERGPDFLRLANALSALYPKGSEEKRLLDAMLLAGPR